MADTWDNDWNPLMPNSGMTEENWRELEASLRRPNYLDTFRESLTTKPQTIEEHQNGSQN